MKNKIKFKKYKTPLPSLLKEIPCYRKKSLQEMLKSDKWKINCHKFKCENRDKTTFLNFKNKLIVLFKKLRFWEIRTWKNLKMHKISIQKIKLKSHILRPKILMLSKQSKPYLNKWVNWEKIHNHLKEIYKTWKIIITNFHKNVKKPTNKDKVKH